MTRQTNFLYHIINLFSIDIANIDIVNLFHVDIVDMFHVDIVNLFPLNIVHLFHCDIVNLFRGDTVNLFNSDTVNPFQDESNAQIRKLEDEIDTLRGKSESERVNWTRKLGERMEELMRVKQEVTDRTQVGG